MINLGSELLTIGPLSRLDLTLEYIDTLNDKEYMQFSRNSEFTHSIETQRAYLENFESSPHLLFAIKEASSGSLVGSMNCYVNFYTSTLELGFLIFKRFAGKGYSTEALGILLPYLEIQYPGMTAIIGTNRKNFAMQRVAKKFKFDFDFVNFPNDNENLRFTRRMPKHTSTSIGAIPDIIKNARNIGVVANDAGGAEQISWLLKQLPQRSLVRLEGPAKRIFENSKVQVAEVAEINDLMSCDLLITGSGWMSQLETKAISEARSRGLPCITILDHWVNFLSRFGDNEECYPQIIAVTNTLALQIANEVFPDSIVYLLPDFQLMDYREKIESTLTTPDSVVLLLEPISNLDSRFAVSNKRIQELLESAGALQRKKCLGRLIVRLHPSQVEDKEILKMLQDQESNFEVSTKLSLIGDLERAGAVLGLNSYALYIAAMCGIETYSCFAGENEHWTKNFPGIINIDKLT